MTDKGWHFAVPCLFSPRRLIFTVRVSVPGHVSVPLNLVVPETVKITPADQGGVVVTVRTETPVFGGCGRGGRGGGAVVGYVVEGEIDLVPNVRVLVVEYSVSVYFLFTLV